MELTHALNRGVDGRNIFLDTKDYVRFIHDMYAFNTTTLAGNTHYSFRHQPSYLGFVNPNMQNAEKLVDIHGWCLMKNHYHLLLSERVEGGLSLFLRKLNVGYANYFNERYKRSGTLFQGRTKKIAITHDAHFLYILHYIHLNPLDYLENAKTWRERSKGGIKNLKSTLVYLDEYRWSSYLDYMGKKNFPSILTTALFNEVFENYAHALREYLQDAEDSFMDSSSLHLE